MFSVTLKVTTKEGLGELLDRAFGVSGVLCTMVIPWDSEEPKAKEAKPKEKRKPMKPGVHHGTVLEVIKSTFPNAEFGPKQIVGVAMQRGVPKASFYGIMHELSKQGKLERPKPGLYKLVVEERKES